MRRQSLALSTLTLGALVAGCASQGVRPPADHAVDRSGNQRCSLAAASPWIRDWFDAWELVSQRILRLPDAPPPEVVFYDDTCAFTTSAVTAGGAPAVDGPALRGMALPWRAFAHDGELTLPDSSRVPIELMSFANVASGTGPFFVMAAPSFWAARGLGREPGLTGVFLHEFAHTRQVGGFAGTLGRIDDAWPFREELTDDAVQTRFGADSSHVAAHLGERDLLYRAAEAASPDEARTLAAEALSMIRRRHARWFVEDDTVFATLDDIFLSLEGVGQWAAYAWLAHPAGGGLERAEAIRTVLGRRRWWTQDEGLALFLVVDRLLPGWPAFAFGDRPMGAPDLLERAVQQR